MIINATYKTIEEAIGVGKIIEPPFQVQWVQYDGYCHCAIVDKNGKNSVAETISIYEDIAQHICDLLNREHCKTE